MTERKEPFYVGFTGTQQGMTSHQLACVIEYMDKVKKTFDNVVALHGDCIGADYQFDQIAKELGIPRALAPCDIHSKRNFTELKNDGAKILFGEQPPLFRNKLIVEMSACMIATPKEQTEVLRSGTWATIRYCRKFQKRGLLTIFYPE